MSGTPTCDLIQYLQTIDLWSQWSLRQDAGSGPAHAQLLRQLLGRWLGSQALSDAYDEALTAPDQEPSADDARFQAVQQKLRHEAIAVWDRLGSARSGPSGGQLTSPARPAAQSGQYSSFQAAYASAQAGSNASSAQAAPVRPARPAKAAAYAQWREPEAAPRPVRLCDIDRKV